MAKLSDEQIAQIVFAQAQLASSGATFEEIRDGLREGDCGDLTAIFRAIESAARKEAFKEAAEVCRREGLRATNDALHPDADYEYCGAVRDGAERCRKEVAALAEMEASGGQV